MDIKDFCIGIQHIGIPTNDLAATIRFYESLGFSVSYRVNNAGEEVAFLQLWNLVIEAYQNREAAMQTGAIDHIAIDVISIGQLFETVKRAGHTMLDSEVQSLPFWSKGIRYFTILGPNNEKIEFCEKLKL